MSVNISPLRADSGFSSPGFSVSSTGAITATSLNVSALNVASLGGIEFASNSITTDDSSTLTIIPATVFNSDVTVENDLTVENTVVATRFIGDGSLLTGVLTGGSNVLNEIQTFIDNDINTSDSSAIVFVPSVEMRSDLRVENDLTVVNKIIGASIEVTEITTLASGTPEIQSSGNISLNAGVSVLVETNGSQRFIIDSNGNTGINNNNPSNNGWTSFNDLVIGNTTTNFAGMTIQSSSSGECGIAFNDTNGQIQAYINYNHSNETLGIGTLLNAAKIVLTGTIKVQQILEKITVSAIAATGTINFDVLTQGVLYYTTNASGNFTLNIRGSNLVTLDSLMTNGESLTIAFFVTNGNPAFYHTGMQIDGNSVTPKWQNSSAPSAGNVNSVDIYTYTIVKSSNSFTVFASQTPYA